MMTERMLLLSALVGVTVLLPTASSAQTTGSSGAAVIDAVKNCRAVLVADQRLACFDNATAALDSAIPGA